jgi:predicted negative regulator of RcsB-dependent stress response
MTELLQQAIAQIQQMLPDQQDAILEETAKPNAARFLAELQDEQQWEARFAATTDEQWEKMAAMVRQEMVGGETVPLDEVFPRQKRNQALPKPFGSV